MLYTPSDKKRVKREDELSPGRSHFRRDFGRLLHSPAFRRLQGKTQLFPGHESDFFRNRLTHSLEVAQVAKGIALQINGSQLEFRNDPIDTDLVELAALAHDLGHPPFGHNGEKALDDCMKGHGGFEGNAQTLRLLARIEKKVYLDNGSQADDYCGISAKGKDLRLGLNLTFRSLAAVLKYDRMIPSRRKKSEPLVKGYYDSEADLVRSIKEHVGPPARRGTPFKTIECQIMDLADDISYSTYDLEDSMKGGFAHPLALLTKIGTDPTLVTKVAKKVRREVSRVTDQEVFDSLRSLFDLSSDASDGDSEYAAMLAFNQSELMASQGNLRGGFTSNLVDNFMRGIDLEVSPDELRFSKLVLDRSTRIQIESLKHLNFELMIMSPRLKVVEYRGYDLVTTIFKMLAGPQGHLLLPEDCQLMYGRLRNKSAKMRLICDFVAGMTDRYAVEFHGRLRESGASIFKPL